MATLNLKEKKIASTENLRLLSSLVISLANKTSSVEDKCITPWKAGETYQKDVSFVEYSDYLWICSVTNQDSLFTESHWTKLTDSFIEITKDDVAALINLSPEEISKLSDLISTEIRLDKTFSSSDTYTRIQAAIDTAKEYTNNQLGKAVKPAYKVVSSTSEVTETGYFYLISNGTNYDMYVLSADGSVVSLGTSEVDLSNYYTKTETDSDFLKKTDATSTYATITTVDGKFDKTNILTALDNSATDDQVYSAKAINAELDGVVKKTDISTTINSASTDDTVPTSKAVETRISKREIIKNVDLNTFVDEGKYYIASGCTNSPIDGGYLNIMRYDDDFVCQICARYYISTSKNMYIRTKVSGTWQEWQSVCTTSVADVGKTFVPFTVPSSITVYNPDRPDLFGLYYIVKNGVCYVDVTMSLASISQMNNFTTLCSGMPKPAISYVRNEINSWNDKTAPTIAMAINGGESTFLIVARNMSTSPMTPSNSDGHFGYFCSFSYPVAEN